MAEIEKLTDGQERVAKALESPDVPKIYFNGFVNSITVGDVVLILECNAKPVATLNMSYTVAKTLALSLGQLISKFETGVGRNMLTTHDVGEALQRAESTVI